MLNASSGAAAEAKKTMVARKLHLQTHQIGRGIQIVAYKYQRNNRSKKKTPAIEEKQNKTKLKGKINKY